ncbi:hypothetical protein C0995_015526 [Termitomyces sp. Mi166|nr:hypothetical protein C0995_015526 [Termitomyces sp. Mi166\
MATANPSTTTLSRNDPLDSLHSPNVADFAAKDRDVDTIASATDTEFNDVALDDEAGLSAVSLTRDPSPDQETSHDIESPDTARPPIVPTPQTAVFSPQPAKTGHKKSASTTTIRSGNNLPFIVSRIQDEHRLSQRGSVDGRQKLQEEFYRLHKEEEKASTELNVANKAIDWDYQGFAAERPEELASAIARGIPDTLRGMMWQHMAASKDLELEGVYLKLLKEGSTHEKAITRDLGRYLSASPQQVSALISGLIRTFPHHDFFNDGQGIGQENLFNVLKAYSLFPLPVVFRIYDNCLASGIEAIFGFSIMLLKKNEEEILALKFDEILAFLNTRLFDKYRAKDQSEEKEIYDVDAFVQDAVALHITPFMLDSYRHEYEDRLRETNKHLTEMDELRTTNRALSSQVKTLENSLAQLNVEHVDLLNELVKSRLRNEEMEEELVRYKLLYAEAMHENQDALSSHRISIAQMLRLKRGSSS